MTAPIPTGAPAPAAHGAPAAPPPAPAAPVSPFEPAGVVFAPVSPRLITARLLGAEGANAVGAILGVALGVAVSPWLHLVAVLLALVADGLDGRAARFFGVSSEMGKEMDSLCDLISFGAAPGVLAYVFALHAFSVFGGAVAICFALCGM